MLRIQIWDFVMVSGILLTRWDWNKSPGLQKLIVCLGSKCWSQKVPAKTREIGSFGRVSKMQGTNKEVIVPANWFQVKNLTGIIWAESYIAKKLFGYCASWLLEDTFATTYTVILFQKCLPNQISSQCAWDIISRIPFRRSVPPPWNLFRAVLMPFL